MRLRLRVCVCCIGCAAIVLFSFQCLASDLHLLCCCIYRSIQLTFNDTRTQTHTNAHKRTQTHTNAHKRTHTPLTLAPNPNRNGEYAVAFVTGVQGNDTKYLKAAACLKHYAAYSQETGREAFPAVVTSQDMEDTYVLSHIDESY